MSATTCPYCATRTPFPREPDRELGGVSFDEFEVLVRNEWRQRLGWKAYGAHSRGDGAGGDAARSHGIASGAFDPERSSRVEAFGRRSPASVCKATNTVNTSGKAMLARDEVCGMQFAEEEAAATARIAGKTYYFCSERCKRLFTRHPERFVPAEPKHTEDSG